MTQIEGVVAEYAKATHRYLGKQGTVAYLGQISKPGTKMARIAVSPTWVGVLDFNTRLPSPLGGVIG